MTEPEDRRHTPLVADEATTLRAFLDWYRATLRWKCRGLDAEGLGATLPPSSMTLGGMLKHLAYVEDWWCGVVLAGAEPMPPFDTAPWDDDADWDWHSAADDTPEQLWELWEGAVAASEAHLERALASGAGLDAPAARAHGASGEPIGLRWIVVHLVEEYARHVGHADLLRESVDGLVGQ